MPEVSRFYGIIVKMYFKKSEHNPPHIHVSYGSDEAIIKLDTLEVTDGFLPNTALYLAKTWAQIHQSELKDIWEKQEFVKIEPLK
jgi:hypothetical protein